MAIGVKMKSEHGGVNMPQLHIIYTSDVHGQLTTTHYPTDTIAQQGLLRVATRRTQLEGHVLLIDGGDFLQGNVVLDYHRRFAQNHPHPIPLVYNALGYEVMTLGNHDFNYGKKHLFDVIEALDAKIVCANLLDREGKPVFAPYTVKTYEGLRVGIIGLVTGYVPNWERPEHIAGWTFADPVETAQHWVQGLRQSVDYLIVLYHGGFECDIKTKVAIGRPTQENQGCALARIPGIDLLLTGHQHVPIAHKEGPLWCVQTGANAQNLAHVHITFDAQKRFNHTAQILINDTPADPQLEAKLSSLENGVKHWLDAPVGMTKNSMNISAPLVARQQKHPLFQWINNLQLECSQADISAASLPNDAPGLSGAIKLRDLAANFIYPNTLTVLNVTGRMIRAALERTAEYFSVEGNQLVVDDSFLKPKVEHYNYDVYDGIDYVIDVSKPKGTRLVSLQYAGKPLENEQSLQLVLNNYRAGGGGDYPIFKEAKIVREIDVSLFDLAVTSLEKTPNLNVKIQPNFRLIGVPNME